MPGAKHFHEIWPLFFINCIPSGRILNIFKYLKLNSSGMARVLARSLSKKKIVTNEGKVIGTLKNLVVDFETGQVVDMIVQPDPSFDASGYRVEGDRMFVPFESVKDIKDYIIVDRYLSRK